MVSIPSGFLIRLDGGEDVLDPVNGNVETAITGANQILIDGHTI